MTTQTRLFTVGEPQVAGALAVFPVFGPEPRLQYRTHAEAVSLGAFVKELDGGASVNDLLVMNPTDQPVLLFEGEEVHGAQQDRTLDVSVLVPAGARTVVPVSCVEQGRWDGSRAAEHFAPAPHAADPSLRRIKRLATNRAVAMGAPARANQGEVWQEVGRRLDAHDVDSRSAALGDVFAGRAADVDGLADRIGRADRQVGSVAVVAGRPIVLDLVSRPDAYASLHERLVRGYALEALDAAPQEPNPLSVMMFLDAALSARQTRTPTPGLGEAVALEGRSVTGGGLAYGREIVQLSAFADGARPGRASSSGGIARPQRRRRG